MTQDANDARPCRCLPLTAETWPQFERLFGPRGGVGGCWCMLWRGTRRDFVANKGAGNREAMKSAVQSGRCPGILLLEDDEPVGWCSVAPRSDFPALQRSRVLRPADDLPCWSITCLLVAKGHRRKGLSERLIAGAIEHAAKNGAEILEAYPVIPKKPDMPAVFAWTGLASSFRKAGFRVHLQCSETRPIMRLALSGPSGSHSRA